MRNKLLQSKPVRWIRGCNELYGLVALAGGAATVLAVFVPKVVEQFYSLSSVEAAFLGIGVFLMAVPLILSGLRFGLRLLSPTKSEEEWYATPKTQIVDKTYKNERVELDGKSFTLCRFENVTFVYRGTAPFDLGVDNEITGGPSIEAPSPNLQGMIKLLATVGALDPNLANYDPDLYKRN